MSGFVFGKIFYSVKKGTFVEYEVNYSISKEASLLKHILDSYCSKNGYILCLSKNKLLH